MRPIHRLALLALLLAPACSSGGDGGTGPGPTPAIALSLGSSSATVVQGASTPVGATLTRSGGFTGTVALTVDGAPSGVTGAVSNVTTSGGTTTATVTVNVAAATVPGTYSLTVRGTGSGVSAASAGFSLTVTAAPDFSLAIAPGAASVVQGLTSAAVTVTITRTNFADAVTLSLGGSVPAGVTAVFTPPAPTGGSASFTVSAAASTAPGVYNLTVSGSGTPGSRSTPFALTVTPAGSFALGLTPAGGVTLEQGATDNSKTVSITRTNYAPVVTLTAENLPAGLTATFTPNPATGSGAGLSLTASGSLAPNTYNITIRGTGPAALRVPGGLAAVEATTTLAVTVTPPAAPDYALSLNLPSGSVAQGGSRNDIVVTIARTNFTGAVTLSLGGIVPPGVTATFAPPAPTGTSSTMTISVGGATPLGIYPLTISGTGAPGPRNTPFTLTVTAPASFTLGVTPVCSNSISLEQNELDDSRVVTITRVNFPDNIQLSALNLPPGLTATFSPNPTAANTSRLTLQAGAAVAPGTYNLSIKGTGPASLKAPGAPASLEVTTPLSVTVTTGAAPTPSVLEYLFTDDLEGWATGVACPTTLGGNWGVGFWQAGLVLMDGVGSLGEANTWISKEIALPANATTLLWDVSAHVFTGADSRQRVRILDGGVSTEIFNQLITGAPPTFHFSGKSADIRTWAGKTVRIFFEQDANGSAHEQIWLDNIRIMSALPSTWAHRRQVTVTAGTTAPPAEYSVPFVLDHAALVSAGKSLASGHDVRVAYWTGTAFHELERVLDPGSAWNTATTRIWFKTQAPIAASGSDVNYYVYYGNPGAGLPPESRARVFLFHDHFESGGLTKWFEFPNGAWTATTTRAHGGTFAAMHPAEAPAGKALVAQYGALTHDFADVYVDSWWNLNSASTGYKVNQSVRGQQNADAYHVTLNSPPFGWGVAKEIGGTFTQLVTTPATPPVDTWFRVGAAIHGTTMRGFIDGIEVTQQTGLTQLTSGAIGFEKFEIPAGASWWVDDVIVRKYVFPEPGSGVGSEQAGPFAAGSWLKIRG